MSEEQTDDLSGYSERMQKNIIAAREARVKEKKKVFLHTMKSPPPNSSVAPLKPEPVKPGGRGPPREETRIAVTSRPTPNRVPKGVPTTLEGALQFEREGKSVHEVLGILVEAQEKEAKAILGRTN